MEWMQVVRMLSGPLIGAVIGYFTNMIAVKMLFYPKKEIRIGGRRLPLTPGVIPKGRPRLAGSIGEVIEKHLLTKEDIKAHLLTEQIEQKVSETAAALLSCNIKETLYSFADMDGTVYEEKKAALSHAASVQIVKAMQASHMSEVVVAAVGEALMEKVSATPLKLLVNDRALTTVMQPAKEMLDTVIEERGTAYITPMIASKLNEVESGTGWDMLRQLNIDEQTARDAVIQLYRKLVDESVEGILQHIHISALVEDKINAMSIDELEQLVQDVMKKELNAIVNLGALIGFVLGLLNLLI